MSRTVLGGGALAAPTNHEPEEDPEEDVTPGEEIYSTLLAVFNDEPIDRQIAIAGAFQARTPWADLPPEVRETFEDVGAEVFDVEEGD